MSDETISVGTKRSISELTSQTPKPPSKYAMSGVVAIHYSSSTLDIKIHGRFDHIRERLREAGGSYQIDFWTFRIPQARTFLCLHDDLPLSNMFHEIDLAELGRTQVQLYDAVLTVVSHMVPAVCLLSYRLWKLVTELHQFSSRRQMQHTRYTVIKWMQSWSEWALCV